MSSYIQQCIQGNALIDDIDDFVDLWHERKEDDIPLHSFLGMSQSEYKLWVADPDVLPHIITAHKQGCDVSVILDEIRTLPLAARSDGPHRAERLMDWLKSEGLWD